MEENTKKYKRKGINKHEIKIEKEGMEENTKKKYKENE